MQVPNGKDQVSGELLKRSKSVNMITERRSGLACVFIAFFDCSKFTFISIFREKKNLHIEIKLLYLINIPGMNDELESIFNRSPTFYLCLH